MNTQVMCGGEIRFYKFDAFYQSHHNFIFYSVIFYCFGFCLAKVRHRLMKNKNDTNTKQIC